jgi:hypothetical protein
LIVTTAIPSATSVRTASAIYDLTWAGKGTGTF